MSANTDQLDPRLLAAVVTSERFQGLVSNDGHHRLELKPNNGRRYVIEFRSLAKVVTAGHDWIVDQDFEAL